MPVGAIVAAAAPAAISAVGSLFGAKKSSNAAKDSANIQTDFAQKALDEQKRVYDIEKAEEARQRQARAGIFDQYGTNPGTFQGNLPNPYGMSDAQTSQMRGGNASQGSQSVRKPLPPSQAQPGERAQPVGPRGGSETPWGPRTGRPTVTLQAPTGEIMDVDIDQVPALLEKGAIMLPKQGAQNAFGGSYGLA
jgi:hypothetical protein